MKANTDLPIAFSGIHAFVEKHGDEIWETICDHFPIDQPFTTAEASELIHSRYSWAKGIAHRRTLAVLRNVAEQPLPDGVEPAIRRLGQSRWIL